MTLLEGVRIAELELTLHEVRRILLAGADGSIVDTIWFDEHCTLVDYISDVMPPKVVAKGGGELLGRTSDLIVCRLDDLSPVDDFVAPFSATRDGLSFHLDIARSTVDYAIRELIRNGFVKERRQRADTHQRQVLVPRLTRHGVRLAASIIQAKRGV